MREKPADARTPHRAFFLSWRGAWLTGLLLAAFSGCVYLRLLEFQNQLAQFDQFFRVEVDGRFILHILEPKILSQDLIYLSSLDPSRRETGEAGETWYYVFQKLKPDSTLDSPDTQIVFSLGFNEKQRLVAVTFSPLFLKIVPPEFLEQSLRSLGKAEIDKKNRQLRAKPESLPKIKQALPTRALIEKGLGIPFSSTVQDATANVTYRYRLQPPEGVTVKDPENRRKAVVELFFKSGNNKLTKMDANFAGLKITIHYEKLADPESPPPTGPAG
ncbi:MAG: hypothetical protein ACE15F_11230 [bacterium]